MNCSLHQVFGAGAFLRLEKTKQEQTTCVTSTLTKSTQIWLQAEQHEHLSTVHLSGRVRVNSPIEWRCSRKRSDALTNGEQRQTSHQWPANPGGNQNDREENQTTAVHIVNDPGCHIPDSVQRSEAPKNERKRTSSWRMPNSGGQILESWRVITTFQH
mgnify:CR=1 FL=1